MMNQKYSAIPTEMRISRVARLAPSVAEQLTAHPIEAELQGVLPRRIYRIWSVRDLTVGMLLSLIGFSIWMLVGLNYQDFFGKTTAFCLVLLLLAATRGSYSEIRKSVIQHKLIQRGVPVPAMVSVTWQTQSGWRIEYVYQAPSGEFLFDIIAVASMSEVPVGLTTGSTFTALVAPDDEQQVRPYFLSSDNRIIATLPSAITQT